MKISFDWLQDHINIDEPINTIADRLTQSGLEVEAIERFEKIKGGLKGVVIGEVLTCEKHPDADKLSVTTVDIGQDIPSTIVCGAPNVATGQKVVVATVGTTLYPVDHKPFTIKKAKIRGVVSLGMLCAEDELGLGSSHDGIIVLDTELKNGTDAAKHFKLTPDDVIEIGLTPNRVDAASHRGTARDLRALLKSELIPLKEFNLERKADLPISVQVDNKEACPRYTGLVIANINVKESPDWLQSRLKAIGISPINNIVDITNYVLHDIGQPIHAFDYAQITENRVIVKTGLGGTKFQTLDGEEHELTQKDLIVCNTQKPMCIAGVFGGSKSGVTENTKHVFIESAYFSPSYIRATSLKHNIKTDAAFRFERGTDPNACLEGLIKAASLIAEIAGGEIASEIIDTNPKPVSDFIVKVKYKNITRLIGQEISKEEIENILTKLEIKISFKDNTSMTLEIPPYRVDVRREADVIEEILRIYGYDNIKTKPTLHSSFLAPNDGQNKETVKTDLSNLLSGFGYHEIITNSLTKPDYTRDLQSLNKAEDVVILNKLSEDLGIMRQTMLFNGLEVLAHNINRRQTNLKFFEFGTTYKKEEDQYIEQSHLSFFATGNKAEESWLQKTEELVVNDLSKVISGVLIKLNIPFETKRSTEEFYRTGLDIISRKQKIGSIGIIDSSQTKKLNIKQNILFGDLSFDKLLELQKNRLQYNTISKFPEVRRDLSVVVDKTISFEEIKRVTFKSEKKIITELNVFDTYEGKNLGPNKKSYSISYTLEDPKQMLKDKVIDKVMTKLIEQYEKQLKAVIRR